MNFSKDGLVSGHTSWVCSSKTELSDVLITNQEDEGSDRSKDVGPPASGKCVPMRLEQTEERSPCVITFLCTPQSGVGITSVLVVSEARTIEVYSLSGDYCGTSRGEEDPRWHADGAEENTTFYRCRLVLECPVASCEVKNKADVLGGLLPLLMGGGALACLAKGPAPVGQLGSEEAGQLVGPPPQSGTHPLPSAGGQGRALDIAPAPVASLDGQQCPVSSDLLPVLQSVCGQVSQLRLHALTSAEAKRNGEREYHLCCGGVEEALEKVVERRMQELERRLKEHMDLRLDALQQRLELALHQAITHAPHPQ
ncbi:ATPase PAAT isoform X3 [Electrophorus electricus]|uniref:ATPase PAAT isoform X3 n=1 Tax=Electrophorus electricus TaxID=8005 RepID=UPI0015CF96E6|nr:ATPase PAAT isoform X3 [Electrophorus electricus]